MFLTRCVKDERRDSNEEKELQPFHNKPQIAWDKENGHKTAEKPEDRRATLAGPDE